MYHVTRVRRAHLRPKPKLKELMSSLTFPDLSSQRLGLNASGSGKTSGSCEIALNNADKSTISQRRERPGTHQWFPMTTEPAGIT